MKTNVAPRNHAIVLGGSLGGLLAAKVLSQHFKQVTIIEKDTVHRQPESRKGQPQTQHLHGLLPAGLRILNQYFSGIEADMSANGAKVMDFAETMNWFSYGGYKKRFKIGFNAVIATRPLLEHLVRERVLALPNILLQDNTTVKKLLASADHQEIVGVEILPKDEAQSTSLLADLVVDVTGRGSRTPQWLKDLGYEQPEVSEVKVNVGYTTRMYKRNPSDSISQDWLLYTPKAPQETRFGGMFPVEDNKWVLSVGGWHGDHPSTDEKGFLEFVKALPHPEFYRIASQAEPLSEVIPFKFPLSLRRHYEKLTRFPKGFLVMGDAVTSFNPTYGQGMSSAALQAEAMDKVFQQNQSPDALWKAYFKAIAPIVDTIWQLATGEDFRFVETVGVRPPGINLVNKYVAKIHKASLKDEIVCKAFLHVMGLLRPPTTLFHPRIFWRVMTA
ncbi:MAG: FAD-dependent monooxygenase [Spirosomataceae bacterium]